MLAAAAASAKARARAPSRILICAKLLRFGWDQHLPVAVRLHRGDHASALHVPDQPRGAVVADAQVPLHERDRRPTRTQHDVHRLAAERVLLAAGDAFCAMRATSSSTFFPTTIIRSASSSITTTTCGSGVSVCGLPASSANGSSNFCSLTRWLWPDMLRAPIQFISL